MKICKVKKLEKMEGKMKEIRKIILFVIALLTLIQVVSATPNSINIQGTLTDSNNKIQTGEFNFSFRIYDNFTSGNKLYETNITATTDGRGVYDIILNNINISFDKQLYLGVQVANDAEMTPRGNLTSVPYTFRANTSEDLDKSKSYTVSGLNITGNLTLAEKITFGFGEIIDNIIDGWIRITGNLNVTQSLIVAGGANISGSVSVNNNINLTASGNIDASGTITADTLKATNQLDIGGGFSQGGLTIDQDGDIITQGDILFSGSVTFLNVSHLSVNGSVNPSLDATFDIGNASLRWRNANFSGIVEAGSFVGDGSLLTGIAATSIADNTITSDKIVDGNVNPVDLNNSASFNVSGLKINGNLNVTGTSYLGDLTLTSDNITVNNLIPRDGGNISVQGNLTLTDRIIFAFGESIDNAVDGFIRVIGGLNVTQNAEFAQNLTVDSTTLHVDSTNNRIGIRTTNPGQELVVVGDLNVTGTSYLGDITLTSDNITVNNILSKDGNITFHDNLGNETLRIDSSGNIGIGTSTPNQKLVVVGNVNITGRLDVGTLNISGVTFSQGDLDVSGDLRVAGGTILSSGLNVSSGDVNLSGALFVDESSGNVGIGTATPAQTLTVVGDLNVTGTSYLGDVTLTSDNITVNNLIPKDGENISVQGSLRVTGNIDLTSENRSLYQPVYPSDDDLVLYLPFSEANGSIQFDRSPFGNDGTQSNNVICNATYSKYGNACNFESICCYSSRSIYITGSC